MKIPSVIQVIVSECGRGGGEDGEGRRRVLRYHTPEGEFLAERDHQTATDLQRLQRQHTLMSKSVTARARNAERVAEELHRLLDEGKLSRCSRGARDIVKSVIRIAEERPG